MHTLDGEAHRHRKALFVALLMDDGVDALTKLVGEAFDEAADGWRGRPSVRLFDESAQVIARAWPAGPACRSPTPSCRAWPPTGSRWWTASPP